MLTASDVRLKVRGLRFTKQLQATKGTVNPPPRCQFIAQHAFLSPVLFTSFTFMLSPELILLFSALNVTL
jgi:hypothetical protein